MRGVKTALGRKMKVARTELHAAKCEIARNHEDFFVLGMFMLGKDGAGLGVDEYRPAIQRDVAMQLLDAHARAKNNPLALIGAKRPAHRFELVPGVEARLDPVEEIRRRRDLACIEGERRERILPFARLRGESRIALLARLQGFRFFAAQRPRREQRGVDFVGVRHEMHFLRSANPRNNADFIVPSGRWKRLASSS